MPTTRGESVRTLASALIVLMLPVGLVGGCGLDSPPAGPDAPVTGPVAEVRSVLSARAAAVRRSDETAFLDGLAARQPGFVAEQRRWFDSVRRLPLARFGYQVLAETVEDHGSEIRATVREQIQLAGHDAAPVRSEQTMRFVREGTGTTTSLRVASLAPAPGAGRSRHPWEVSSIRVRQTDSVLAIFDRHSVQQAPAVLSALDAAAAEVAAAVPYRWDRRVVLYALAEADLLASVPDLPGGDPDRVDAVVISVPVRAGADRIAGHRVLLHPRMLGADQAALQRLLRHELTHVALGRRDDHAPVWLREGLAEWVAARSTPAADRSIPAGALRAARSGAVTLPADTAFTGSLSGTSYGLAWWACEHIAATAGPAALWGLLEAFGSQGAGESRDDVLRRTLGLDSATLARHAAAGIVDTFG